MSNISIIDDDDIVNESNIENHIESIQIKINNIRQYTVIEKKEIVNKIKSLSKIEHIEIFKILRRNNIKYTENSNGIFINLINIDNNIIKQIDQFISFCLNNKDSLVEKENIINEKKIIIDNKYYSSSSSNSDEETTIEDNYENKNIDGSKINLKKNKPTYTGIKAKIMKNYKEGVRLNK